MRHLISLCLVLLLWAGPIWAQVLPAAGATSHETTTTVGSYTMDWTAVDSTEWVTVAAEFKPAGDAETAKASLPYPHLTGSPAKPALIGGLF